MFPTHTLTQRCDVKLHPVLKERWNAYYVHAIPWQAVVPLFSDEFLFNFDLLQRLRRVPSSEQITFAIKQFSALIKDRWPSILQAIRVPVTAEFIKERHRLLIYGLATERILLSNLNEQYYNHDLNSVIDISRNIMQASRSHVRLIALKAHPENRLNEIFSVDVPPYSPSIQTTCTQPTAFGAMPTPTGYTHTPGTSGPTPPYQMGPRIGQFGPSSAPQSHRQPGEYHDATAYPQEKLQYPQGHRGGPRAPYGAVGGNRYYGRQGRGMEPYQRTDMLPAPRYPGYTPRRIRRLPGMILLQ